jgi:type VI secretion system protein ImpK
MKAANQPSPAATTTRELREPPVDTNSVVSTLLVQIMLARATDLARAGRYSEAENLLSEVSGKGEVTPAVLDLSARIRAQQGRLLEAEALWRQASQLDPANEAYRAGLHRIVRMQRRPIWIATLLPWLVGLIVVGAISIAGFAVRSYVSELRASLKSEVARVAAAQEAIRAQLQGEPPNVNLKIPGASLRVERNDCVIIFDSGLFARGAELKPDAKTTLTELGRQLEPYVGRLALRVIGHTDDLPMPAEREFRDNIALGMARAVAVVDHLRATTRLPSSMFTMISPGEHLTPYANDTPENRERNRTVVIRLSNIRR